MIELPAIPAMIGGCADDGSPPEAADTAAAEGTVPSPVADVLLSFDEERIDPEVGVTDENADPSPADLRLALLGPTLRVE